MNAWQWTPANTSDLVNLWTSGLSAGQVSRALGKRAPCDVSRSAVLGKLHRLGLLQRKTAARAGVANPFHQITRSRGAYAGGRGWRPSLPPEPFTPSDVVVDSPNPVAFLDMPARGHCRWPLETEPFTFCGNASPGKIYCSGHHRVAYDSVRTEQANRAAGLKSRAQGAR
jgi:hypothetical protein